MANEFVAVENYLHYGKYPEDLTKGEKANFRRKCRNNFKFDAGILYYKVKKAKDASNPECDAWRVCFRTEEERKKIIEACHAGAGGILFKLIAYSTCIDG